MAHERLQELLDRHFGGGLTEEEMREMNGLLSADPQAPAMMVRWTRNEMALAQLHGRSAPTVRTLPTPTSTAAAPRRAWRWWAGAAAAAAMVVLGWNFWESNQALRRAAAGDQFTIDGVRVTFATDGVVHQMAEVDGRRRLEVRLGVVDIEVRPGSAGVRVVTPEGVLTDLGTTFRVDRGQGAGPTRVSVKEGSVRFDPATSDQSYSIASDSGTVSLTADGAVGSVRERRGTLQVRPRGSQRFSLADERSDLWPGDWIRTGTRGAHGGRLLLVNGTELTLGPGCLLEVVDPSHLKIYQGDVAVSPGSKVTVTYDGPAVTSGTVSAATVLRASPAGVVRLSEDPQWLTALRADGAMTLGSLLAEVDGRRVPLTMGYHKVTADIQDQIARTIVEESFVNHTDQILEGEFLFPLPAKASVSGFAMWIGDLLVEGEIVEKQRAREIFETLLREKRDPALLEWTGGNIFKARVYPIPAHGEKRVKITYTEVLTGDGAGYRYHYPLKSDLTRLTPLRQLEIRVSIGSTSSIDSVLCTTHAVRTETSPHAARLEFRADEYVADRDFELRVATQRARGGATVLSHRRGGEGYLMALLDGPLVVRDRDVLPEGVGQDVILLLDTSHSVRGEARQAQVAFLEAFLQGLSPQDTVQLATVDAEVAWAFEERKSPSADSIQAFLDFHAKRFPLGWTDLATGIERALQRAREGTQIVYVGDGIATSRFETPAETVRRSTENRPNGVIVHTVALGNEKEISVLEGLPAIGNGSHHTVGSVSDAADAASDLWATFLNPGWTDVRVRFEGGAVAAIHSDRILSLPAGRQALVLARFDPVLGPPSRLLLEGFENGQPLSKDHAITLDASSEGNSFLPRLWARKRLDHLLAQGDAATVRETIVQLSEEFQIITPYTSFLVLETEEDRQRFQVEKRLRMRDGEEFFAAARTDVDLALARQQIELAHRWRVEQRRALLKHLELFGRASLVERSRRNAATMKLGALGGAWDFDEAGVRDAMLGELRFEKNLSFLTISGELELGELESGRNYFEDFDVELAQGSVIYGESIVRRSDEFFDLDKANDWGLEVGRKLEESVRRSGGFDDIGFLGYGRPYLRVERRGFREHPFGLIDLFPPVPEPSAWLRPTPWPEAARALVRGVTLDFDGLMVRMQISRGDGTSPLSVASDLVTGPQLWSSIQWDPSSGSPASLEWLGEGRRGAMSTAWFLGRTRAAVPADAADWPKTIPLLFTRWDLEYADWRVQILSRSADRATLRLERGFERVELVIDPSRQLLLEQLEFSAGREIGHWTASEPISIAGRWIPTRLRAQRADGTLFEDVQLVVEQLDERALMTLLADHAERRSGALLLDQDSRASEASTRDALARGEASLTELLSLFDGLAARQQIAELTALRSAIEKAMGTVPGAARVSLQIERARVDEAATVARAEFVLSSLDLRRPGALAAAREFLDGELIPNGERRVAALDRLESVFSSVSGGDRLIWVRAKEQALRQASRPQEALDFVRRSAAGVGRGERPADLALLLANALFQNRLVVEAVGTLETALAGATSPEERGRLFDRLTGMLQETWQIAAASDAVRRWIEEVPAFAHRGAWSQRLTFLAQTGHFDQAFELLRSWLTIVPDPALPWQEARLIGSLDFLTLGQVLAESRANDLPYEEPVLRLAAELRDRIALRGRLEELVRRTQLQRWDDGRSLIESWAKDLAASVATRDPSDIASLYAILSSAGADASLLTKIRQSMFERFVSDGRRDVDRTYQTFFQTVASGAEKVTFWKELIQGATDPWLENEARSNLASSLVGLPWSEASEAMLLDLLPRLGDVRARGTSLPDGAQLAVRTETWQRAFDWMSAGRVAAATESATKDPTTSPRRRKELRSLARRASAREIESRARRLEVAVSGDAWGAAWLRQEALYWAAQAGDDVSVAAVDEVVALLSEGQPARDTARGLVFARAVEAALAASLEDRASSATRERLLASIRTASANSPDAVDAARRLESSVLLAFDRRTELLRALTEWFAAAKDARSALHGPVLAWTQVDADLLEAAVATLEATASRLPLASEDHERLALWRLALGDKDAALRDRRRSYDAQSVQELLNGLAGDLSRVRRRGSGVPEELSDTVPERLESALRRDTGNSHSVWYLEQFYTATRDFRLIETFVSAMTRMSEASAVALIQRAHGLLLEIQDEATVDRVGARARASLDSLEPEARRGLLLFDCLLRCRAGQQQNAGEPHLRAARDAFERFAAAPSDASTAVTRSDALMMFTFLEDAAMRARVLEFAGQLQAATNVTSEAGHRTGRNRAVLFHTFGRKDQGIEQLAKVIESQRSASGRGLAHAALGDLDLLCRWLREVGSHLEGELLLNQELALDHEPVASGRLLTMVFDHAVAALAEGAMLAAGRGSELYGALRVRLEAEIAKCDDELARRLVSIRMALAKSAKDRAIPGAYPDLLRFADQQVPRLLRRVQHRGAESIVGSVASALEQLGSALDSLRFLVTYWEAEPSHLRWLGQDFWSQHAWRLGNTLRSVTGGGPLRLSDESMDRRLEGLAARELELILLGDQWRHTNLFDDDEATFWSDKRDVFVRLAVDVAGRFENEPELVMKVAQVLIDDLSAADPALELAFSLHHRRMLSESDRLRIAGWATDRGRFAEAQPIVDRVVTESPLHLAAGLLQAKVLEGLGREVDARESLQRLHDALAAAGRLDANTVGELANAAVGVGEDDLGIGWFRVAIESRQKMGAVRGDHSFSAWHQELADALGRRGRHREAVDAAAGAIVVWTNDQNLRGQAIARLDRVIRQLPDLAEFGAELERRAGAEGRDVPVLRLALARALMDARRPLEAAHQAAQALSSGPPDVEVHRLLIAAWTKSGRLTDALAASLAAVDEFGRSEAGLLEDLVKTLEVLKRPSDAERARTSWVELQPGEAEGYARLALERERQDRFREADALWQAVAELRREEPRGLIGRLRVLIRARASDEARVVLATLRRQRFDARFTEELREVETLARALDR